MSISQLIYNETCRRAGYFIAQERAWIGESLEFMLRVDTGLGNCDSEYQMTIGVVAVLGTSLLITDTALVS